MSEWQRTLCGQTYIAVGGGIDFAGCLGHFHGPEVPFEAGADSLGMRLGGKVSDIWRLKSTLE
jgi:hypothetical protein